MKKKKKKVQRANVLSKTRQNVDSLRGIIEI